MSYLTLLQFQAVFLSKQRLEILLLHIKWDSGDSNNKENNKPFVHGKWHNEKRLEGLCTE
jgi:hypothetical protein